MDAFVEQLLAEKGHAADVTPPVYQQMKQDLSDKLTDFINAKVIAALSDEHLADFEKLLDKKAKTQELQQYIENNIPNGTAFLTNVLLDFRTTYLGRV